MDHDLLVALKALADPNRLRVAAACADGPRTASQIAAELRMAEPAVRRHLDRLQAAALVSPSPADPAAGYTLQVAALHGVGRQLGVIEAQDAPVSDALGPAGASLPPDEVRVIRGYLRDDRLSTIPSQEKKRLIVIRYLRDRCFPDDRPYLEKEVNQRLALFHPDVATLRRAMVDEGLMVRANGVYRRPA